MKQSVIRVLSGERMKSFILPLVALVLTVIVGAVGVFVAGHDWAVEELMETIHVGPASPFARLTAQATARPPEWTKLETILLPLDEMCHALRSAKSAAIRESADGYCDAVGRLRTAIEAQDVTALQGAAQAFGRSCVDCHGPGGVGGELPTRL
jgi:hypothetical protein